MMMKRAGLQVAGVVRLGVDWFRRKRITEDRGMAIAVINAKAAAGIGVQNAGHHIQILAAGGYVLAR
jgi:hypothetical protein